MVDSGISEGGGCGEGYMKAYACYAVIICKHNDKALDSPLIGIGGSYALSTFSEYFID